jgi:signal recognition particle GTPase
MKINAEVEIYDDDYPNIEGMIVQNVSNQIYQELGQKVKDEALKETKSQFTTQVESMIKEALTEVIQPRDTWGEPKGQPKTFKQLLADELKEYMKEEVDEQGKRAGYGDKRMPRAQYLIKKALGNTVDTAISEEVKLAYQQIKNDMEGKVTEAVKRGLKDFLKIS